MRQSEHAFNDLQVQMTNNKSLRDEAGPRGRYLVSECSLGDSYRTASKIPRGDIHFRALNEARLEVEPISAKHL